MKSATKLRLKEDLLAHVGPKVAWYSCRQGATAAAAAPNLSAG